MKYRSAQGVVLASVCGKYCLVTPDDTVTINETAAFYWNYLRDGIDENELFEKAKNEFEIDDENVIRSEITELIRILSESRLVVRYDM